MSEKDEIIEQLKARIKELEISMNEMATSSLNVCNHFAKRYIGMKTFEGIIIKSDYGDYKPDLHWQIFNSELDKDDGEFLEEELRKIGKGKRVCVMIEEI